MLAMIISKILNYRRKKYMDELIKKGLKIGKNTHILNGAFLDPSHCFLISIGDNCTIAPNVRLIAHDASIYKVLGVTKISKIIINDNSFIGDSAIVLPGVSIGPNAIIGAGSVVTRNIPSNSVAAGNPAEVIASFDEFMKRHSENREKYRCFSEEQYNIAIISEECKKEMLAYFEKHQVAYMKYLSKRNELKGEYYA